MIPDLTDTGATCQPTGERDSLEGQPCPKNGRIFEAFCRLGTISQKKLRPSLSKSRTPDHYQTLNARLCRHPSKTIRHLHRQNAQNRNGRAFGRPQGPVSPNDSKIWRGDLDGCLQKPQAVIGSIGWKNRTGKANDLRRKPCSIQPPNRPVRCTRETQNCLLILPSPLRFWSQRERLGWAAFLLAGRTVEQPYVHSASAEL